MKAKKKMLKTIVSAALAFQLLSGTAVYAQQEWRSPVINDVTVSADESSRSYNIRIESYSSLEVLSALPPVSVAAVPDVSFEMAYLSEEPDESQRRSAELLHKSIDQNKPAYTEKNGNYVPIFLKDDNWYVARVNDRGERVVSGESIGKHSEDGDVFSQDIYIKGETKTFLECQLESLVNMAECLAAVSPESEFGIIAGDDRIGFERLNQEGTERLKAELEGRGTAETRLSKSLEQSTALMEKAKNDSKHVIFCMGTELTDRKKDIEASLSVLNERIGNVKLYGLDFTGRDEPEPMFEAAFSDHGDYYRGDLDSLMIWKLLDSIMQAEKMTVEYLLDPRFDLSAPQKRNLNSLGLEMTETEDGGKKLSRSISLPRPREFPEVTQLEAVAKAEFPGGNDVPISIDASGVFSGEEKKGRIEAVSVNVPLKLELTDIEAEIFRGQRVPAVINGQSIEDKITERLQLDWYGREPTGEIIFGWEYGGEALKSSDMLKSQMPGQDKAFEYTARYTPLSSGGNSIGKPLEETSRSAVYNVRLVSGTVHVIYDLTGQEENWSTDSYAVFKLQNESFTQYRSVSLKNRTEDGEFLKLEAVFTQLPYGTYRVSREYCFTETGGLTTGGMEDLICSVGIDEQNGSVDLNRDSCIVYADSRGDADNTPGLGDGYYAETKVGSFRFMP